MPPLIAISAPTHEDAQRVRVRLNLGYARGVERAGGVPVIVPPLERADDAARVLDSVDGLMLTGGADVDPARYGAPRHSTVEHVSAPRDATELALLHAARARAKPVLAICRGIQLMNVAFGGTLVQDIPSEVPGALPHDQDGEHRGARVHTVRIEADSILARALGATQMEVNSLHHQAPKRIPDTLRLTASAPDGIVEGLEWRGSEWWAVGVQWHPEELDGRWEAGLFTAFVREAGATLSRGE
jgi:putative glutamine amidotransferase